MSISRYTLYPYVSCLASVAVGSCLASRGSIIFLSSSPHAIALNTAVAMGLDYLTRDRINTTKRIALTVLCGILTSKGLSALSKKFDMSIRKSTLASCLQLIGSALTGFYPDVNNLEDAVCNNDIPRAQFILEYRSNGITPFLGSKLGRALCSAATLGRLPMVKVILKSKESEKISAEGEYGLGEALNIAAEEGHLDIAKEILECEESENIPPEGEYGLGHALCLAVKKGRVEIREKLHRAWLSCASNTEFERLFSVQEPATT